MTNTNRLGMTNKELGALGEDIAAEWMLSQGFRVIHRNWRYKNGCEIDIVARRASHGGGEDTHHRLPRAAQGREYGEAAPYQPCRHNL